MCIRDRFGASCGASIGDKYGPLIVSKAPIKTLTGKRIAIPGEMTTAYLTMKLFQPDIETKTYRFDQIIEAVQQGEVDAGLIIHEGQLTYAREGLHKIVDLGEWWHEETGLPLPLGANVIRRNLCLLYTSPSPRDRTRSRMPSSA